MRPDPSDALIKRLGERIQREARGDGYAARLEGEAINIVVFSGDQKLRAELSLAAARTMTRRDLDTEAARIGLALRSAFATLPKTDAGKTG